MSQPDRMSLESTPDGRRGASEKRGQDSDRLPPIPAGEPARIGELLRWSLAKHTRGDSCVDGDRLLIVRRSYLKGFATRQQNGHDDEGQTGDGHQPGTSEGLVAAPGLGEGDLADVPVLEQATGDY